MMIKGRTLEEYKKDVFDKLDEHRKLIWLYSTSKKCCELEEENKKLKEEKAKLSEEIDYLNEDIRYANEDKEELKNKIYDLEHPEPPDNYEDYKLREEELREVGLIK